MRRYVGWAGLVVALTGAVAFGEEITPPSAEEFKALLDTLLAMIGGTKGITVLSVVTLVAQGIMLWTRSSFGDLAGKYRLILMTFVSLVLGVAGQLLAGQNFFAALFSASVLPLLQLFGNQVWKQFFEKVD